MAASTDTGTAGDNQTSNATPTFTGMAEAGAQVVVRMDGRTAATVVADLDGSWTYTPSASLSAGRHTIAAVAQDAAGNTGAASAALTFIIEKPTTVSAPLSLVADADTGKLGDGVTAEATPTLTGVVAPGGIVAVTVDGKKVASVTADASTGAWTHRLADRLSDGLHVITARSGTSPAQELQLRIDTVDPTKPAKAVLDIASDTGITGDGRTTDARPVLRGTAEADGSVQVYVDGGKVATVATDATGAWSYRPDAALTIGEHAIQLRAVDTAGNVSDKSDATLIVIQSKTGSTTLTTGVDDIVATDEGITVTATSATLTGTTTTYSIGPPPTYTMVATTTPGDRLVGGAGQDTLQLYGSGEFRVERLAAFTGFERIVLSNPTGSSGSSSSTNVYLGAQDIELATAQAFAGTFHLGSGRVVFRSSLGGELVAATSASWNIKNIIENTTSNSYYNSVTIRFGDYNSNQQFDLREATLSKVSVTSYGGTLLVNSKTMASVKDWTAYNGQTTLATSDAAIDLGAPSSVYGSFRVTSTNTTGTTFTATDATMASRVYGGTGQDTLVLKGSAFTADQRNALFATTSIETITDTSGTYGKGTSALSLMAFMDQDSVPDVDGAHLSSAPPPSDFAYQPFAMLANDVI